MTVLHPNNLMSFSREEYASMGWSFAKLTVQLQYAPVAGVTAAEKKHSR